ncbi:MAG: DUF2169 domain-containing protein [Polaromonas sp.]
MKIIKPDSLGLLHRSTHVARQNQLTIGMLAFFSFGKSSLPDLLAEAQMWPFVAEALGKDAILDEGWAKTSGEFLMFGNAYTPDGKPATDLVVMAQVGSLKKSLFVRGDRHFNKLGLISDPTPFTSMAISPANAFGGPTSLDNPLGKGLVEVKLLDGSSALPLPNVENVSRLILRAGERAAAEGFWPYAPAAPQRTQHLGAFDQPWVQKTWPHLPEETRPAYFQVAPTDQRLSGFFQGNEKIQIYHMHPQQAQINAALPQLRARCFVNRKLGGGEEFSETTARAETVWLFPNQACGIVLYRAVVTTQDEDAEDVLHLMADWEDMQTAPLPLEHYRQAFLSQLPVKPAQTAQLDVPTPQAPVAQALAVKTAAVALPVVAVATAAAASYPALDAVKAEAAKLEAHTRQLMQQHGITDADIAPYLKQPEPAPAASLAEVEKMAKELEDSTRALMKQHNITDAQVAEYMKPPVPEPKPGPDDLKNAVKQLNALTEDAMKKHGITVQDIQKYADSKPEMADFAASLKQPPQDIDQAFAGLSAALAAAAKPPTIVPPKIEIPKIDLEPPKPEPTKKLTREDVVARHAGGKSMAGFDLAGLDLSKLDLSGADFSQSLLQGTNFEASDLSRVRLAGASAGAGIFKAAKMSGSDVSQTDFTGADFSDANLSQSNMSQAIFDGAKMPGLQAAGCTAQKTSFAEGDLTKADFSNADVTAAVFNGAKLAQTRFNAAKSDNAEFYGADASQAIFSNASLRASRADASSQFAGAQFASAQLGRANWEGAAMAGAGFERANLDNADFSRVQAGGAKFNATSAKGCKFDKADLSGADLSASNLFKGSLRKTKVANTLLRRSNLYGVDFYGTTPTLAALEGANIDQTLLVARKPVI